MQDQLTALQAQHARTTAENQRLTQQMQRLTVSDEENARNVPPPADAVDPNERAAVFKSLEYATKLASIQSFSVVRKLAEA